MNGVKRGLLGTVATVLAAGVLTMASPSVGHADTFNLTIDNCTGGCNNGTQPFATVTVTPSGANLDFTVSLNTGYVFNKSTGLDAFVFGFTGAAPTVTISAASIAAGFSNDPTLPQHEDGFGDFQLGILKADTGGALLTFTVLGETLANLASSTGAGGTHVLFAADILGNGNTGPVGGGGSQVPIPGAVWLFGTALAGLGLLGRRKNKVAALTA